MRYEHPLLHPSAHVVMSTFGPVDAVIDGWFWHLIRPSPLQAVAVGSAPPSLYGPQPWMGFDRLDEVGVAGDDQWDPTDDRLRSLGKMWQRSRSPLAPALRSAMAAVDEIGPAQAQQQRSDNFPKSDLGKALSAVSRTIRGDIGASVITVDQGDWDMHSDLGTVEWGRMQRNADDFARSVAAFFEDLGPSADRVTLVTVSEFGRRVVENNNYGLDHGWGNVMFLFGAGVKGGYRGTWAGLGDSHDADLTVTTDYRSVLSEVVRTRTTVSTATVFPQFSPERVGAMTGV